VSEVETKPEGLPSLEEVKALLGSEGWNPSARRTGVTQGALARLESVAQELPLIFQDFRDSGDWSFFPFMAYVEMYWTDLRHILRHGARTDGWMSVINVDTLSACLCGVIMSFALLFLRVAAYFWQLVFRKGRDTEREQVILRKVPQTNVQQKWLRRKETAKEIDWSSLVKGVEVHRVPSGQEEFIALTVCRGRPFVELMLKLSELEQIELLEVSSRVEPVAIRVAGMNAGLLEMKRFFASEVRGVQFPCATPRRQYCLVTVPLQSVFACLRAVLKEGGEVQQIYPEIP
jgi:hypothetical protein